MTFLFAINTVMSPDKRLIYKKKKMRPAFNPFSKGGKIFSFSPTHGHTNQNIIIGLAGV